MLCRDLDLYNGFHVFYLVFPQYAKVTFHEHLAMIELV